MKYSLVLVAVFTAAATASAQDRMVGMSMTQPSTLIDSQLQHTSSGTSVQPPTTPLPMLMGQRDGWTLMLHSEAFVTDTQQHATSGR